MSARGGIRSSMHGVYDVKRFMPGVFEQGCTILMHGRGEV